MMQEVLLTSTASITRTCHFMRTTGEVMTTGIGNLVFRGAIAPTPVIFNPQLCPFLTCG